MVAGSAKMAGPVCTAPAGAAQSIEESAVPGRSGLATGQIADGGPIRVFCLTRTGGGGGYDPLLFRN